MPYYQTSGAPIQYQKSDGALASGYYLKFYASGTTTPINMYSTIAGAGALAKCALDTSGYPVNGSNAVFVPVIDQKYKLVLYKNSTDADANTFASADWEIDGQVPFGLGVAVVDTLDDLKALDTSVYTSAQTNGYDAVGDGGGGQYWYNSGSSATPDNFLIIQPDAGGGRWHLLSRNGVYDPRQAGAKLDGTTNDAVALQKVLSAGKNLIIEAGFTTVTNAVLTTSVAGQQIVVDGTIKAGAAILAVFSSTDFNNVIVKGVGTIDCNSNADNGVIFVATAANPVNCRCEGITVKNTKGTATATKGGVYVLSSAGKVSSFRHKDFKLQNFTARNCGDLGALIAYTDGVLVQNCIFDTCAFHGHESVNCSDVLITGNLAQDCAVSGVGVGDDTHNWVISNNVIRNCAGDGSITAEFNSVFGTISDNTIYDANTSGINLSLGAPPGSGIFAKVQNVTISGNSVRCKSGVTNKIGINYYSGVGPNLGHGVNIVNNAIQGFNIGIAYQYSDVGSISNNVISELVGTSSAAIKVSYGTSINISDNQCSSDSADHAIQLLDYAGNTCNRCNVVSNHMMAAGTATKALVYIEGTGTHYVIGNRTGGSLNHVNTTGASTVYIRDNYGNLAAANYVGSATFINFLGSATASTVGASAAASALPANPLGYVTVFIVGVGQAKIPYYNL